MSASAQLLREGYELLQGAGINADPNGARQERATKSETPAVMTTSSLATGEFMDRTLVEQLVDLTVGQSGWLNAATVRMRDQKKGEISRMDLNEVVTEGTSENAGDSPTTHPGTDTISYETAKFKAVWYYTVEDLREARASGESNFRGKLMAAFAKAMGNDLARWVVNGDTSLDTSTRLNRLLRQRNGWLKLARASANYYQTTRGSAFARGLFNKMLKLMPERFRDDAGLRWLLPSSLDMSWNDLLQGYAANASQLGEQQLQTRRRVPMQGIEQLIVPQMPTAQGFSVLAGSTADADVVSGSTSVTARVNTLFGGYSAAHAGRLVKITYDATGQSEICTVVDTGSNLTITTTGMLGQSSVSTTVTDYTLDLADITSAMLTNPGNLFIVMNSGIRAYSKFEQEFERWRIDVFYDATCGIFNEDAVVLVDGIIEPTFDWGE